MRKAQAITIRGKKAVSILEYAFLIGVMVGVCLIMQNYVKRSMQGQLQFTADGWADQYSPGLTDLHEHFESDSSGTAWALPGPVDITSESGSFKIQFGAGAVSFECRTCGRMI